MSRALPQNSYTVLSMDPMDLADAMDCTTLHTAILFPSSGIHLSQLIEQNFKDINKQDRTGTSPLHWACTRGDMLSAQLLLEWGADVNIQDNDDMTALHHACWACCQECVQLLLNAGANLELLDSRGAAALSYIGDAGVGIVRMLIEREANIDHRNKAGRTALHEAATHGISAVAQELLECGANMRSLDADGRPPLHDAILHNNPEVLALLLQNSVLVRRKPLHEPL
jgi:ankyrin repeat protein